MLSECSCFALFCRAWSLFLCPHTLLYRHLNISLCNILFSFRNHICILNVLLVWLVLRIFNTLLFLVDIFLIDLCSWSKHPWSWCIIIVIHPWRLYHPCSCTSLLVLLITTLGCYTSRSNTLGRVSVLVVFTCVVGCNKSDNTLIALFVLLSVNGISRFRFAFIAVVNSSSAVVAQSATVFFGNSNFDGMNTYVSVSISPC